MLSGIIIAKNSEKLIERAIKNLNFCDEVIVVDGGSTDSTIEISKKNKAKVIVGSSTDFSKQRNMGLKESRGDWVFYMDTDELVSDELRAEIVATCKNKNANSAYFINRQNYYLGNHKWPKIEQLQRLFKKTDFIEWYGKLHETPKYKGEAGLLNGFLLHYTHQDLTTMVNKTNVWSDVEAKLRLDANHPKMSSWRFFRVMLTAFFKSYFSEGGLKAGTVGIVESIYQAYSMFITYAKLWELQNKK